MRKLLFALLALTSVLMSCQKDEIAEIDPNFNYKRYAISIARERNKDYKIFEAKPIMCYKVLDRHVVVIVGMKIELTETQGDYVYSKVCDYSIVVTFMDGNINNYRVQAQ